MGYCQNDLSRKLKNTKADRQKNNKKTRRLPGRIFSESQGHYEYAPKGYQARPKLIVRGPIGRPTAIISAAKPITNEVMIASLSSRKNRKKYHEHQKQVGFDIQRCQSDCVN